MQTDIATADTVLQTGYCRLTAGDNFIQISAAANSRRAVLFIPPFAEEMNKSRHLISATMRQLSTSGFSCFLLDNYGTGDSAGDLDAASMTLWRDDLHLLLHKLKQSGYSSIGFVAIRFGTLQLFDLLNHYTSPLPIAQVVLWQPVFDMAKFWQQFARIKIAEAMANADKLSQKQLEQQLDNGEQIEIAGYPISPAFYQSLLAANTSFPQELKQCSLCWLETSQLDTVAVPVEKMRQQLAQHCQLVFQQIKDEPYWQTTELATALQLQALTLAFITKGDAA